MIDDIINSIKCFFGFHRSRDINLIMMNQFIYTNGFICYYDNNNRYAFKRLSYRTCVCCDKRLSDMKFDTINIIPMYGDENE